MQWDLRVHRHSRYDAGAWGARSPLASLNRIKVPMSNWRCMEDFGGYGKYLIQDL